MLTTLATLVTVSAIVAHVSSRRLLTLVGAAAYHAEHAVEGPRTDERAAVGGATTEGVSP